MTNSAHQIRSTSSAAEDEIEHFTRLAAEWWDMEGDFKSLHQINALRMSYIKRQLCHHFARDPKDINALKGLSIVDIGCGGGLICEPLSRLGADIIGIDATEESVNVARVHATEVGLEIPYHHKLPEELADEGSTFDVVINMEVIEHVNNVEKFMTACAALLKPSGLMIGSTLNRTVKSLALAKFAAEYILRWVPPGTHDWRKFVKPSEFAGYIRQCDLVLSDLTGMRLDPLKTDWVMSKNLDVNYFITAKKPS